jgi:aromatic-L-amino-acid decarboxylase
MERARSIAFDFHKWAQVPYDAGCILVRDQADQFATFAGEAAYLTPGTRGLAANAPWPCDLGPDLSRGFRALKVWFTVQSFGATALGAVAERSCALARTLVGLIEAEPELELLAPVPLNIVCFRFRASDGVVDALNTAIVADIQEAGLAALHHDHQGRARHPRRLRQSPQPRGGCRGSGRGSSGGGTQSRAKTAILGDRR